MAILTSLAGTPAHASPETDALREQIRLLEQRIDQLERKEQGAPAASPQPTRVGVKPQDANVSMNHKGFKVQSADGNYAMQLGGAIQLDSRWYVNNGSGSSEFRARRLRPQFRFTVYDDISVTLAPEFASSTQFADAYMDYRYSDALKLRLGKFKTPVSYEILQSQADLYHIERGTTSTLAPLRDAGLMAYGDLFGDTLLYQVGIFNGNADYANSSTDSDDNKDVAARLFARPFEHNALEGLGFGVGSSIGSRNGTTSTPQLATYRSPGQLTYFSYGTGTIADGTHWRVFPQIDYHYGSAEGFAEYGLSSVEVRNGGSSEQLMHRAWQVVVGYVLTGEDAPIKGSVVPAHRFDPKSGGWGAFKLAGRLGQTDLDNDTFPTYASSATSATQQDTAGLTGHWFWNENFKLMLSYDYAEYDGGSTTGDRQDEHAIFTRAQLRY